MYKEDLALNNLQWLIKPNQTNRLYNQMFKLPNLHGEFIPMEKPHTLKLVI